MAKRAKSVVDQGSGSGGDVVGMARGLAQIVSDHHLTELVVEANGTTITVRRELTVAQMPVSMPIGAPATIAMPMAAGHAGSGSLSAHAPAVAHGTGSSAAVDDAAHVVTSPFVGTFYRKPNPDSPAYVSQGDRVEKGQVLCIVEAMKLMNEIEADASGTIVGILVEDGVSVEYGQPLFRIAT